MAAGSFLFENKLRPGCYIQIKGVPRASSNMSERGTVAILMNADSGNLITELSANDILTGASSAKGFPLGSFTDTKSILNYVYPYVNSIIVCRLNAGGTAASVVVLKEGETPKLTATAKFAGIAGNKLSVLIVAEQNGEGKYKGTGFFVRTSMDGEVVDEQNIKLATELKDNDYVKFTKAEGLVLAAVAAKDLTGGANGTESEQNLTKILSKLSGMQWNTLGFCGKDENRSVVETYIKHLREDKGKYRQGVLFNMSSADYEGIISTYQAFAVDDDDVEFLETPTDGDAETRRQAELRLRQMFAVGFVAAITAGSDVNISNTYAPVPSNVVEVIPAPDEDEDVEAQLKLGLLTFTHNSANNIVIEKDINTLHTYTQTRTAPFSKNRVIRTLDELSNTKVAVWESMFIGKIDNNPTGRNLLKSQIMNIIQSLVKLGALSNSDVQITVEQGDDVDKVRSYETVRPIDAMEQLYSYVTVLG